MINGLSLFSGIGGIDLALAPWVRPIAYCENDRYAQGVLLNLMHLGHLETAGVWDDVRTLERHHLPVDRIRGLGNAVVPQAAREAFTRLMGIK